MRRLQIRITLLRINNMWHGRSQYDIVPIYLQWSNMGGCWYCCLSHYFQQEHYQVCCTVTKCMWVFPMSASSCWSRSNQLFCGEKNVMIAVLETSVIAWKKKRPCQFSPFVFASFHRAFISMNNGAALGSCWKIGCFPQSLPGLHSLNTQNTGSLSYIQDGCQSDFWKKELAFRLSEVPFCRLTQPELPLCFASSKLWLVM